MSNNIELKKKAKSYVGRFLEPGLVTYEKPGGGSETFLIRPENVMKMAKKFKGCPIIIEHQDVDVVNDEKQLDTMIVGRVSEVFEGDFTRAWANFTIDNRFAVDLIDKGYELSCTYAPVYGPGGIHHNTPYDKEIVDLSDAEHIAIVEKGRYEGSVILENSKTAIMRLFTKKQEEKEQETKKSLDNSIDKKEKEREINENSVFKNEESGDEISVKDMINSYMKRNEREAEEEKKKANTFEADDEIEIDGKKMKLGDLFTIYQEEMASAQEEEAKEEEEKEQEEMKIKEEEEQKKKEEAVANSKTFIKIKEKRQNALENFKEEKPVLKLKSREDLIRAGRVVYGSPEQ